MAQGNSVLLHVPPLPTSTERRTPFALLIVAWLAASGKVSMESLENSGSALAPLWGVRGASFSGRCFRWVVKTILAIRSESSFERGWTNNKTGQVRKLSRNDAAAISRDRGMLTALFMPSIE